MTKIGPVMRANGLIPDILHLVVSTICNHILNVIQPPPPPLSRTTQKETESLSSTTSPKISCCIKLQPTSLYCKKNNNNNTKQGEASAQKHLPHLVHFCDFPFHQQTKDLGVFREHLLDGFSSDTVMPISQWKIS